jgi:hypothetical protein
VPSRQRCAINTKLIGDFAVRERRAGFTQFDGSIAASIEFILVEMRRIEVGMIHVILGGVARLV